MNNVTQSIDIPKNKYYQETNTYPETTTYKINGMIVNKQIFYIIRQLCSQHNSLQEEVNEKDKEIERLNNDYKILKELQMKTNEENNRLNNIINELEKDIDLELYKTRANDEYNNGLFNGFRYVKDTLDKLKELKEGKNES